ncbi:acylphosphatase [Methylomagnum sp.]
MTKRVHVWVSGRVQGVYFRGTAREQAVGLGLVGWARNLSDGRVEILAEGGAGRIAQFLAWCRSGPPMARVEDCRVIEETPLGDLSEFEVRRGGIS